MGEGLSGVYWVGYSVLAERKVAWYLLPWVYIKDSGSSRGADREEGTPIIANCLSG